MIKKSILIVSVVAFVLLILSILPNEGLFIYCTPHDNKAEFSLIDPLGRNLGYDPIKKIKVLDDHHMEGQMPDSCYFYAPVGDDVVIDSPKYLTINQPIAGIYILKVYGMSNSEHYTIDLDDNKKLEGVVKQDQIIGYYIMFIPTPFKNIQYSARTDVSNAIITVIMLLWLGTALLSKKRKTTSAGGMPVC